MSTEATRSLISAVRQTRGWKRVELVELLLRSPEDDVCEFLLREGLADEGLAGYVALAIAQGCNLAGAIGAPGLEDALLTGIGRILAQLASDAVGRGPDGDMGDYPEGAIATVRYVTNLQEREGSLADFLAVDKLRSFALTTAAEESLEGWTRATCEQVVALADHILARPSWRDLVARAVADPDNPSWRLGLLVGQRLGLSLGPEARNRLTRDPFDPELWQLALAGLDAESATKTLELAVSLLDLPHACRGAAAGIRFGPELLAQFTLEGILQALRRLPGSGTQLVQFALRAPRTRTRLEALDLLFDWPGLAVPNALRNAVEQCLRDPDERVRTCAEELLKSWHAAD